MCPHCDECSHGDRRKAEPIIEEKKSVDGSCCLNCLKTFSQTSTISIMPERSNSNVVYRRKKPRGSSDSRLLANGTYCISLISSDGPLLDDRGQVAGSRHERESEVVGNIVIPLPICDGKTRVSELESFNGCTIGEGRGSDETLNNNLQKNLEVDSINDSCSSSKSNVELVSTSMKVEVDDTGECSSSSIRVVEDMSEDISGRDLCISILKSNGLLPCMTPASVEESDSRSDNNCSRLCKFCGHSELVLKMLICDHCEDAFHVSCCHHHMKKVPNDEWYCNSCLKKKPKLLRETISKKLTNIAGRNRSNKGGSNAIALMLKDNEPYTTGVRIGKGFQADVPEWSGPIHEGTSYEGCGKTFIDAGALRKHSHIHGERQYVCHYEGCQKSDKDATIEPLEMNPSESFLMHERSASKPCRLSSIGNWLQCQQVMDGVGGVNGAICGKWRRAPLFEVQTDNWECFCSILWDPTHADCAVPQELETGQVLKQLKYIEMLRPRIATKRRKLDETKRRGNLQNLPVDTKHET